jgi:predicted ATPase
MENHHVGIRSIKIRDFRGISHLDLSFLGLKDLPTPVVVIGGPNGAGKTAVLEACLWAAGYQGALNGKTNAAAIRSGANSFEIEISFQLGPKSTQNHHYEPSSMPVASFPSVYFSSWRAPGLVGALGITSGKRGRRPDHTEQNRFWRIKQYLINARAHDLFPVPNGSGKNGDSRYQVMVNSLNTAWSMFYPGESFSVEPTSDDPDAGFDIFLNSSKKTHLSIEVLSSGQLELFSFAGGLLVESFSEGLIVIDEPELHLDPQWHRQLLRALMSLKPECQIIVGTHSSEIYESVHSFQRHFLVSDHDPRAHSWNPVPLVEQVID